MEEPCFVGVNDTMISSPRIDNQSSCRALLDAIEDGNRADGINIIALFDHEEIGSNSKQGAASIMLHDMLRRILRNMDLSENEIDVSIYDAMLLSVDVAHALHPNKRKDGYHKYACHGKRLLYQAGVLAVVCYGCTGYRHSMSAV